MKEILILIKNKYWYHGYVVDYKNGIVTTTPVLGCDKTITTKIDTKILEICRTEVGEDGSPPELMWFRLEEPACDKNPSLLTFLSQYLYSQPIW